MAADGNAFRTPGRHQSWWLPGVLFWWLAFGLQAGERSLALRFDASVGEHGAMILEGVPEKERQQLEDAGSPPSWFQAGVASDTAFHPMAGHYRVDETRVLFQPLFPWQAGLDYEARVDPGALGEKDRELVTLRVCPVPLPDSEPAEIRAIYPTADGLPENLLKFYLHFSAPMRRGEVYQHIDLLTEQGTLVELPFFELAEELWDPELRRLTLLIDPGRVKHGLKPHEEAGAVLERDREYTLRIRATMTDAHGRPLGKDYEKVFRTGQADHDPIDIAEWRAHIPRIGTRDPVTLIFPKPMDHALLQRVITVEAEPGGDALKGEITVSSGETEWHFVPEDPWRAQTYELVVDSVLEDLVGNRIGRAFEREPDSAGVSQVTRLPFEAGLETRQRVRLPLLEAGPTDP